MPRFPCWKRGQVQFVRSTLRAILANWTCPLFLFLVMLAGCAENSMVLKGKVNQYEQQQLALSRQNTELQNRANSLDKDNQELGQLLAQTRQQSKVFEDQLGALRDQLRSVTAQLAQARSEKENTEKKVQALNASMQRQGGVTITPNNSFLQTLPAINLPDVFVRRDGDVIRVELPCSRLFESGTARLRPGGPELIVSAATELLRNYPDQIIGVEGHSDNDLLTGGQWRSNHELSVARAMAVYDVLVSRTRLQGDQLFVAGHGSNHPVVSNATMEGKQRNRRVELVVYPERKESR
jgi:flagellar motor protein MotB